MKKRVYIIVGVITIFIIIAGVMLSTKMQEKNGQNTEIIGKVEEKKEENIQALETEPQVPETWDLNKVYPVLSEDNIYVPVPIGWSISTSEDERYVNGRMVEKKISSTPLTFSANTSDAKPWRLNGDNVWVSGNKGVDSSTSELLSDEFTIGAEGGYVSVVWSVSSETGCDKLSLTAVNTATSQSTALANTSGIGFGTVYASLKYETYEGRLETGTYILSIKYTKDSSGKMGLDSGYIKSGAIKNVDEEGNESITVKDKSGGFVIYEGTEEINDLWAASKERNQFVWVPVENISRIYEENATTGKIKAKLWYATATGRSAWTSYQNNTDKKAEAGVLSSYDNIRYLSATKVGSYYGMGMPGYSKDELYKELETEYKNTIKSIEKYGGFYIGRYETGNLSSNIPVVRRMNTNINYQSWYTMYPKMRNMSSNPNIQTSMIWGSLFDETLQWLIDTEEKTNVEIAVDSISWGNYVNATFQYYNNNGELTNTKSTGGSIIPTGSAERNKANNIYDLAGNVWDWTLEGNGASVRCCRGGSNNNSSYNNPAHVRNDVYPNYSYSNVGFCAYFYIK